MEEKTIIENPGERLKMISQSLNLSYKQLWQNLGYENGSTVNAIIYGQTTKITQSFAKRVVEYLPNVNFLFIMDGKLPVLLDLDSAYTQSNIMGINPESSMQIIAAKLDVISKSQMVLLRKLDEIEKLLKK